MAHHTLFPSSETCLKLFQASCFGAMMALPAAGDIFINELSATQTERLLVRDSGEYPRVGNTLGWQIASYDDSQWKSGPGPLGFGVSGISYGSNISGEMEGLTTGLYLRKKFNVSSGNAASSTNLQLAVRYNDGFIAFLNGKEIARRNLGHDGMFAFADQVAFNEQDSSAIETMTLGVANSLLQSGENILSIQVHNSSIDDGSGATLLLSADLRLQSGSVLADDSDNWKYFPGLAEPSGGLIDYGLLNQAVVPVIRNPWALTSYNDSAWGTGIGPVGMETEDPADYILGTDLTAEMSNITPSVYIRNNFSVTAAEAASSSPLSLNVDYDDGVIIYLNGVEVFRRGLGDPFSFVAHNETSSSHNATDDNGNPDPKDVTVSLAAAADLLTTGDNTLAIQLHNSSITSSDAIAKVSLSSSGVSGRTLVAATDPVSYFVGVSEPPLDPAEEEEKVPDLSDSKNDWIELRNTDSSAVSLAGWSLSDDLDEPRKWSFPDDATIPANGYLTVIASGLDLSPSRDGSTYVHTNFKLSSSGDSLILTRPDNGVEDEISSDYPPQTWRHSYGRQADGALGFQEVATPGAANLGSALDLAPGEPEVSSEGGFYSSAVSLTLSSPTPGASILYTTDGSDPLHGLTYTSPLSISSNTIVRACTISSTSIASAPITHTYLIGENSARQSLAAICLGGDDTLTFYGPNTDGGPSDGEGIFSINDSNDSSAFHSPLHRGRSMEKPATLELLPLTGTPLRTELGLRIAGSTFSRPRYSLDDSATEQFSINARTKPSFNIYFRSEFGESPISYPVFPDNEITRFSDIRIRAGKNDIRNPFITDEFMRRVYAATGQEGSVGTFNTLWINGVYKGFYNMTERLRQSFMQEHHGGNADWDIIQGAHTATGQQENTYPEGDDLHWQEMLAYLRSTNLTTTTGYAGAQEFIDIDNFIDYIIVNAYGAVADWPDNNWVASRERSAEGRWRFYMWDAELSLGGRNRDTSYNTFTSDLTLSANDALTEDQDFIPVIYTYLKDAPEFRLRFADRAQKHLFNNGALVNSKMSDIFQELKTEISPIMLDTAGSTLNEGFHNTWVVSTTRRTNFINQLDDEDFLASKDAPLANVHGGDVASGFQMTLTANSGDAIFFTTDGSDPRASNNSPVGTLYSGPVTITETTQIRARAHSGGTWSAEIEFTFQVAPLEPTFIADGTADWTNDGNWSTSPADYPDGDGAVAVIPGASLADRNIDLHLPVSIGSLTFDQGASDFRNRVRDRLTGNFLTFSDPSGTAELIVNGSGIGFVEFENEAGVILEDSLQLEVNNISGDPEFGALRLREEWSGLGGLTKTGLGMASLTGGNKNYLGATVIEEGVLSTSAPAAPSNTSSLTVLPGGQLRLTSGTAAGEAAREYQFGGLLTLSGTGRGAELPDGEGHGKLGALRYDPGDSNNHALISTPVALAAASGIHVIGDSNLLEITTPLSGNFSFTKSGGGTLGLAGDQSSFTAPIEIANGSLETSGSLGSPIQLSSEFSILSGYGSTGVITGNNGKVLLAQTLLEAPSSNASSYSLVFGQEGLPDFSTASASGNPALIADRISAVTDLNIYLTDATPTTGSIYQGGFVLPMSEDLAVAIDSANVNVFIPDALGTEEFENDTWSQLSSWQLTTTAAALPASAPLAEARMLELRIGAGAPLAFETWQAANFTASDLSNALISGPLAEPFGDGLSNLLRYAFGVPTGENGYSYLPQSTGTGINFPFDSGRDDIEVSVESSDDLSDWSAPYILFDSASEAAPSQDELGRITISDIRPAAEKRFYRVKVNQK